MQQPVFFFGKDLKAVYEQLTIYLAKVNKDGNFRVVSLATVLDPDKNSISNINERVQLIAVMETGTVIV